MCLFNNISVRRIRRTLLLTVVLASMLISGCGSSVQPSCSYTINDNLAPYLAPFEVFDQIYAITPARMSGDGSLELVTPYFTALFDQTRRTLSLKPIGATLQISPLPSYLRPASEADAVFGDLNTIRNLFDNAFSRLGAELVGDPLVDGLLYNDMENRFEMYFTNLGFFMAADGRIHLLHYGAWVNAGNLRCATEPTYGAPPRTLSDLDADYLINEWVRLLDQNVPGSFIGFPQVRIAYLDPASGMYLKPYRGGVVTLNPADPDQIGLVKIYHALGYAKEELQSPTNEPGTLFYVIADGKGYNIREEIYNWVGLHSGQDLAGKPVMNTLSHAAGYIDCFEAYCVILRADKTIEAYNLGERYFKTYPPPAPLPTATNEPSPTPTEPPAPKPTLTSVALNRITVKPWDTSAGLVYGLPLYIHAGVFASGSPVTDAPLYLILTLPGGGTLSYDFPLTNQQGMTSILLENFSAGNGDIIEYEVCLDMGEGQTDVCSLWFFTFRKGP